MSSILNINEVSNYKSDLAKATVHCISRCGLIGSLKNTGAANTKMTEDTLRPSNDEIETCLSRLV